MAIIHVISFNQAMNILNAEMRQKVKNVTLNSVEELTEKVVDDTPVGDPSLWSMPAPAGYEEGTLKHNWNNSLSAAIVSFEHEQTVQTEQVMNRLRPVIDNMFGKNYYLTNNTPYSERIEYAGWSTQAPFGMVRKNAALFPQIVRNYVNLENA
jgi:hypothetical protein